MSPYDASTLKRLHLVGTDHERLTYRRNGHDFRLTDVAGKVMHAVVRVSEEVADCELKGIAGTCPVLTGRERLCLESPG